MIEIITCTSESDFSLALKLAKDYLSWLNMDLSFQEIEKELSGFAIMYGSPNGLFLLAWQGNDLVGGVGLRKLTKKVCEMKRLYVYDHFKRQGAGRKLCLVLIKEAKRLGYEKMRLDTVERLQAAISLYKSLGFYEIEPYYFNPDPTTSYLELSLT